MAAHSYDFDDEEAEVSDINMVPLIDVMLVLLIIFIITMPMLTQAVKIDLPRAAAAANQPEPERVNVTIDERGRVYWNDRPVDTEELQVQLEEAVRQEPQPELHVRGDRKVEYEHVLQVMAAAQRAGISRLGFVSDPEITSTWSPSAMETGRNEQ